MTVVNMGASIRDRLLSKARAEKLDFNLLLTRYALERMLYRLSISQHREQFLLKGALLFDLWFDVPHRPTHDIDFLGFGAADISRLEAVFRDICRIESPDGMVFQPDSVKGAEIRKEANYSGIRLTLMGLLDSARCPVQIDVGFGDAVVPGPEDARYPIILPGMPEPQLRVYPRYTVVAEKLEALTSLGMLNSRMKDFFDLWVLAKHSDFDGSVLSQAVAATFERRSTALPEGIPIGLSDGFINDAQKAKQWLAFLRKNALEPMLLETVIGDLRDFLLPVLASVSAGSTLDSAWRAGEGWLKNG
ncbi:MAG: nucleotidyl transferase AbiEii/AbiGii toxin family protein [Propionivibrio sp.]|uniref:Nucleotidyl transferase AbiEii/AbiGii toxin family protein n=1 Tax=Candidatus Propionivibrio dominans TaxID=2954373 RepID=A0A9D7I7P6_9RHOO|nr:nucleotidyl transferase AbiEii/AbiGii toxin family protein [Candidatus Propionivibrio dominans]